MKIYTKTGDQGETCLFDGSRTTKNDLRMECIGDIDELGAHLGLIYSLVKNPQLEQEILNIIQVLFQINAQIAGAPKYKNLDVSFQTQELEQSIDKMDSQLTPLSNFIFPVGNPVIGETHVARAICRRAERKLVRVSQQFNVAKSSLCYINRLSDWLFTLTRFIAVINKINEIPVIF